LTALEGTLPRVRNYHMAAVEQDGQVVFLHELRPGGADRSYGIHVAELAGIPRAVTARASALLAELEGRRSQATARSEPDQAQSQTATEALAAPDGAPGSLPVAAPLRGGRRRADGQLSLFDVAPSPVLEYLRRLNINEVTPLQALNLLYELQKLAGEAE
jgi:DNA mismatch repair protein MutS